MASTTINATAPRRALRLPEVIARTGRSRSSIYRDLQLGHDFPRPFSVGPNSVAWAEAEIEAWLAARIAERDGGAA